MTFSCTLKTQVKFKGIRNFSSELEEIHINNWYVNWLTIFRKRFALITNSQTLFTVLMYSETKSELKNFEQLFIQNMEMEIKFLNHKMNDIPIKILKYKSPKQVMTETLLEQNKKYKFS